MKSFRKIFTALIGFDRRERRGTYILSVMLVVLLVVRLVAFRYGKVPDDFATLAAVAANEPSDKKKESLSEMLFSFDPNDATYDDLLKLGLTERQARTLVNYRSSGAQFRRPEDLLKVYGVDSATAVRLIPWIIIADNRPDRKNDGLHVRQAFTDKLPSDRAQWYPGAAEKPADAVRKPLPKPLTDLNRCTARDLAGLPGIGPVLSERIIKYRSLLGGFVETRQLGEVYGLDSAVISLISPRLTLTFDSVTPIMLDSVSFGDLARHPYVGYESARVVTRYRSISGSPLTLGIMVSQGVITQQQAERLAPYVKPSPGVAGDDYEFISSKVLK